MMILITGGSGFIGGHLVEVLCARGERVRCLVRRKTDLAGCAEVVLGDLVRGAGVEQALDGVDLVIHLAGVTKALRAEDYYLGNVRATEKLALAVAARGIRMVHVSSLAAVGPSLDGTPVREDDEARPVTHYGKSKLEGERIVRQLVPDAVIVRPPVVYGPRDRDVFQVLKPLSRGIAVQLGSGERWFSAIYVGDLVEGLIAASAAAGRTYFLANSTPVSWGELRDSAARIMGRGARVLQVPRAAAYAAGLGAEMFARLTGKPGIISREKVAEALCPYWTCDTRLSASEIGFEARTSLDAGLALTLEWYREAGWLKY
ncbi:MAG TPA: NAD-dependent epimerase/dehydratase family protein [Bryobacteraceae bacterium]|nr:NAD-dependent epimerase/dehydratase family protein [Bryobacteraceae bacterium]